MGCKELWIGCHVSCKKKALIMKKDQDSQQIFVIFWLGKGGEREVRVMIILASSGIHGGGL
jgi:hypothetical protein